MKFDTTVERRMIIKKKDLEKLLGTKIDAIHCHDRSMGGSPSYDLVICTTEDEVTEIR